jgi:hypothetical protein
MVYNQESNAHKNFAKRGHPILNGSEALIGQITEQLHRKVQREDLFPKGVSRAKEASAVLLLLGQNPESRGSGREPCVLFNKRSLKVKQPGDLCFPGGRISPHVDRHLSRLLGLPLLPLSRWPYWHHWRIYHRNDARRLALLLTTGLREGLEEMRLNPLGVRFLGPLPSQELVWFRRVIYPMVGWIAGQRRFMPNWEVEKIVRVPLGRLLIPENYARYRLCFNASQSDVLKEGSRDFPCFVHKDETEVEYLWGATYRIVTVFLKLVFGFDPPRMQSMPIVHGALNEGYLNGSVLS